MSYRIDPAVNADLGPGSDIDTSVHPPIVRRLQVDFIGWLGDDLLEAFPVFLATERLARAIDAAQLSGVSWGPVEAGWDEQAAEMVGTSPEFPEEMPEWRWMKVERAVGADFWVDSLARLSVSDRALDLLRTFRIDHATIVPNGSPAPDATVAR